MWGVDGQGLVPCCPSPSELESSTLPALGKQILAFSPDLNSLCLSLCEFVTISGFSTPSNCGFAALHHRHCFTAFLASSVSVLRSLSFHAHPPPFVNSKASFSLSPSPLFPE